MEKNNRKNRGLLGFVLALALTLGLGLVSYAHAAGLNPIGGIGARAKGMGGAGIAVADDASAFFYNPALLGESGSFVQVGADFMQTAFSCELPFYGSNSFSFKKYNSPKSGYFTPLIGFNYRISPRITAGLGVVTPNMLGADFKDSTGFYSKMSLTQIAPAISYKITDTLTIGLSLKAGYGQLKLDIPVFTGQFAPNQPISIIRLDNEADGWGYSGQIGILWKATPWLKVGAMYQSKTRVSLNGTSNIFHTISGSMGTDDFSTNLYFPGYYGLGAGATFGNLLIALDIIRSDYSSTDKASIHYTTWPNNAWPNGAITLNWQNNISCNLGVEYKLSNWRLRTGASYQNGVIPDETINPATSDLKDAWTASLGIGYRGQKISVDLAYVHAWGPPRTVTKLYYLAKYSASIDTVSVAISYRFGSK